MRMSRRVGMGMVVKPFYLYDGGLVDGYQWNCTKGNIPSGGSAEASYTNGVLYVKTYKGSSNASNMYARCDVYPTGGSATGGVNIDVRKYKQLHAYVSEGSRYHMDGWPYIVINGGLSDECYVDLQPPSSGNELTAGERIANIRGVSYIKTVRVGATLTKSSQTAAQYLLKVTKIWVD